MKQMREDFIVHIARLLSLLEACEPESRRFVTEAWVASDIVVNHKPNTSAVMTIAFSRWVDTLAETMSDPRMASPTAKIRLRRDGTANRDIQKIIQYANTLDALAVNDDDVTFFMQQLRDLIDEATRG